MDNYEQRAEEAPSARDYVASPEENYDAVDPEYLEVMEQLEREEAELYPQSMEERGALRNRQRRVHWQASSLPQRRNLVNERRQEMRARAVMSQRQEGAPAQESAGDEELGPANQASVADQRRNASNFQAADARDAGYDGAREMDRNMQVEPNHERENAAAGPERSNHGSQSPAVRRARVRELSEQVAGILRQTAFSYESVCFSMTSVLESTQGDGFGILGIVSSNHDSTTVHVRRITSCLSQVCGGRVAALDCSGYGQGQRNTFATRLGAMAGYAAGTSSSETDGYGEEDTLLRGVAVLLRLERAGRTVARRILADLSGGKIAGVTVPRGVLVLVPVQVPDAMHDLATQRVQSCPDGLRGCVQRENILVSALMQGLSLSEEDARENASAMQSAILLQPTRLLGSGVSALGAEAGFPIDSQTADAIADELSCLPSERAMHLLRTAMTYINSAPTVADIHDAVRHTQRFAADATARRNGAGSLAAGAQGSGHTTDLAPNGGGGGGNEAEASERIGGTIETFPSFRVPGITLSRAFPPTDKCQFEVIVPGDGVGYCTCTANCNTHCVIDRRLGKIITMSPDKREIRIKHLERLALTGGLQRNTGREPVCAAPMVSELTALSAARMTHPAFLLLVMRWLVVHNHESITQLVTKCPTWRALVKRLGLSNVAGSLPNGIQLTEVGLRPFYQPSELGFTVGRLMQEMASDSEEPRVQVLRRILGYVRQPQWWHVDESHERLLRFQEAVSVRELQEAGARHFATRTSEQRAGNQRPPAAEGRARSGAPCGEDSVETRSGRAPVDDVGGSLGESLDNNARAGPGEARHVRSIDLGAGRTQASRANTAQLGRPAASEAVGGARRHARSSAAHSNGGEQDRLRTPPHAPRQTVAEGLSRRTAANDVGAPGGEGHRSPIAAARANAARTPTSNTSVSVQRSDSRTLAPNGGLRQPSSVSPRAAGGVRLDFSDDAIFRRSWKVQISAWRHLEILPLPPIWEITYNRLVRENLSPVSVYRRGRKAIGDKCAPLPYQVLRKGINILVCRSSDWRKQNPWIRPITWSSEIRPQIRPNQLETAYVEGPAVDPDGEHLRSVLGGNGG